MSMANASIAGARIQYEAAPDKDSEPVDRAAAGARRSDLAGLRTFKVLTSNVHKGFGFLNRRFVLRELREAVREVGADVVFLQEVLGSHQGHAQRVHNWPDAPQYEYLADTLWPNFAYGRNSVYPEGHHGNALLSKFPIVRFDNHDVSAHGDEKRGVLHAVINNPSVRREIHVCCVHFGLTESHREAQLRLLRNLVTLGVPDDAPLIVAGDFNDWRLHGHRFLVTQLGLREVFADAHGRVAKTFPARWPMLCLDRIYVRNADGHAPVALPRKPWSHLSDHAPLVAEIQL